MALNITVSGLTAVLGNAWFQQGGQTPLLAGGARFGAHRAAGRRGARPMPGVGLIYGEVLSGHNVLVYVAVVAVPVVAWLVYRTRFGLRLRAVGESPGAVDTAGISVARHALPRADPSGVLCGLSGAYLSIAHQRRVHPRHVGRQGLSRAGRADLRAVAAAADRSAPAFSSPSPTRCRPGCRARRCPSSAWCRCSSSRPCPTPDGACSPASSAGPSRRAPSASRT